MTDTYQLAPEFNNQAGYVVMSAIVVGERPLARITSMGTFATAREIITLDSEPHDDGFYVWQWRLAALTFDELAYLEDTFFDGERHGDVTVMTRNRRGEWIELNAKAALPRLPTLIGEKYGDVVIDFTEGEIIT